MLRLPRNLLLTGAVLLLVLALNADLLWRIHRYSFNWPYADQWSMVPLLKDMHAGALAWPDLWAQHNEHRILFPRLLLLALAACTGWNVTYELGLSYVIALATFIMLIRLFTRTARRAGTLLPWLMVPGLAVLHFSLSQSENWLFGMNLVIFLCAFTVLSGIILLTGQSANRLQFVLALLCAVLASGTFANGLLLWFIGAGLLAAHGPRQYLRPALWIIVGSAVIVLYSHGYLRPAHHPPPVFPDENPGQFVAYMFTYLGAPVSYGYAAVAGAAGLLLLVLLPPLLVGMRICRPRALAPYLAVGAFVLASAALTACGRAGFSTRQALDSRYLTFSLLFWHVLMCLLYFLAAARRHATGSVAVRAAGLAAGLVLVLLLALVSSRSFAARGEFSQRHDFLQRLSVSDE